MIPEAKQGLEEVLHNNDTMRRNQEKEEDIKRQEQAWREKEQLGKHKKNKKNKRNKFKWTLI